MTQHQELPVSALSPETTRTALQEALTRSADAMVVLPRRVVADAVAVLGTCQPKRLRLPLTPRQRQVYDYIAGEIAANGVSPSYDEIGKHFKWTSLATVYEQVSHLQTKGWIVRTYNTARSISLVPPEGTAPVSVGAPTGA